MNIRLGSRAIFLIALIVVAVIYFLAPGLLHISSPAVVTTSLKGLNIDIYQDNSTGVLVTTTRISNNADHLLSNVRVLADDRYKCDAPDVLDQKRWITIDAYACKDDRGQPVANYSKISVESNWGGRRHSLSDSTLPPGNRLKNSGWAIADGEF